MFLWTAMRKIEDVDEVGYAGHLRMELGLGDHSRTGVWWAPLCDLTDVIIVGSDMRVAEDCALLHVHVNDSGLSV